MVSEDKVGATAPPIGVGIPLPNLKSDVGPVDSEGLPVQIDEGEPCKIWFSTTSQTVDEYMGMALVQLERSGDLSTELPAKIQWRDGSAKAGQHYVADEDTVEIEALFAPGAALAELQLLLIENDALLSADPEYRDPDMNFFVDISQSADYSVDDARCTSEVIVQDSGFRGTRVRFVTEHYTVLENEGIATLELQRKSADVSKPMGLYVTATPGTAVEGEHFVAGRYLAVFEPDQDITKVEISLIDNEVLGEEMSPEVDFRVEIEKSADYVISRRPIAVVVVEDADHRDRYWVHSCADSLTFKITMFLFTVYALFGTDVWALTVDYEQAIDDVEIGIIIASIVAFVFEIVVMSLVHKGKYVPSINMVMDTIAMLAMVLLLPWVRQYVVFDASLARVNRVGKVAARASRAAKCGALLGKCVSLAAAVFAALKDSEEVPELRALTLAELDPAERSEQCADMEAKERVSVFAFANAVVRGSLLEGMEPEIWPEVLGPQVTITDDERAEIYLFANAEARAALIAMVLDPAVRLEAFDGLNLQDQVVVLVRMPRNMRTPTALHLSPEEWAQVYDTATAKQKAALLTVLSACQRAAAVLKLDYEEKKTVFLTSLEWEEEPLDVSSAVINSMPPEERKLLLHDVDDDDKKELLQKAMKEEREAVLKEEDPSSVPSSRIKLPSDIDKLPSKLQGIDIAPDSEDGLNFEPDVAVRRLSEMGMNIATGVQDGIAADGELNPLSGELNHLMRADSETDLNELQSAGSCVDSGSSALAVGSGGGAKLDSVDDNTSLDQVIIDVEQPENDATCQSNLKEEEGKKKSSSGGGRLIPSAEAVKAAAAKLHDEQQLREHLAAQQAAKDKADEQMINNVGHIGAELLQKLATKVIVLMIMTMLIFTLLSVDEAPFQQQYGLDALVSAQSTYGVTSNAFALNMDMYKYGYTPDRVNKPGAKYNPGMALIYLKINGILYNDGLETSLLDNRRDFTELLGIVTTDDGCRFNQVSLKDDLQSSDCLNTAIWDYKSLTKETAMYSIWSVLLMVVLILMGIGLMAGDFHSLMAGPAGSILAVSALMGAIFDRVDQLASDFHGKDTLDENGELVVAEQMEVGELVKVLGMEYQEIRRLLLQLFGESEESFNMRLPSQRNSVTMMHSKVMSLHATLMRWSTDKVGCIHEVGTILEQVGLLPAESAQFAQKFYMVKSMLEPLGVDQCVSDVQAGKPVNKVFQNKIEEIVVMCTMKALGDTADLVKRNKKLAQLMSETHDIKSLIKLLTHLHQEAVAEALMELGAEVVIPQDLFSDDDPNPIVLMSKAVGILEECGSPRSLAALDKLQKLPIDKILNNLGGAVKANSKSPNKELSSADAVGVLSNMLQADNMLPPGFLSTFDKQILQDVLGFVQASAAEGVPVDGPYSAQQVSVWITMASKMVLQNPLFDPDLFGQADRLLTLFLIVLMSDVPPGFKSPTQHLLHQVEHFSDDLVFFPSGRPESLLVALKNIAETDAQDMVPLLILSAKEFCKNVNTQTGDQVIRATLTIDKQMSTIPEGYKRSSFEESFQKDVGMRLNIRHTEISIASIESGSVIVVFEIPCSTGVTEASILASFPSIVELTNVGASTTGPVSDVTVLSRQNANISSLDALIVQAVLDELTNVENNGIEALSVQTMAMQLTKSVIAELDKCGSSTAAMKRAASDVFDDFDDFGVDDLGTMDGDGSAGETPWIQAMDGDGFFEDAMDSFPSLLDDGMDSFPSLLQEAGLGDLELLDTLKSLGSDLAPTEQTLQEMNELKEAAMSAANAMASHASELGDAVSKRPGSVDSRRSSASFASAQSDQFDWAAAATSAGNAMTAHASELGDAVGDGVNGSGLAAGATSAGNAMTAHASELGDAVSDQVNGSGMMQNPMTAPIFDNPKTPEPENTGVFELPKIGADIGLCTPNRSTEEQVATKDLKVDSAQKLRESTGTPGKVKIQIPEGKEPGDRITGTHNGSTYSFKMPSGVKAGQYISIPVKRPKSP